MTFAPWQVGSTPARIDVGELSLRAPTPADADFWVRLHRDARTYAHEPEAMASSDDEARAGFDAVLAHWRERGFGYVLVLDGTERVGVCGVRQHACDARFRDGYLNLYYRLSPQAHGRGIATRVARAVVEWAYEFGPDLPVVALAKRHNVVSCRVAERCGLFATLSEGDDVYHVGPHLERVDQDSGEFDDASRAALLDMWTRVTAVGGAVGFAPGTPASEIKPMLDAHLDDVRRGLSYLGLWRAPSGDLLGFGWWRTSGFWMARHVLELKRFQVDPTLQRRHLGRTFLTSMHRWARDIDGIELLALDYRSGAGLGDFYAGSGYVETGRAPLMIRTGPGLEFDAVTMHRRLDATPLRFNGRT